MNAVYVVGDAVGETMFYGAGAGSFPTASAVVSHLTLADPISHGSAPLPEAEPFQHTLPLRPMDELETIRAPCRRRPRGRARRGRQRLRQDHLHLADQPARGRHGNGDACSVIFLRRTRPSRRTCRPPRPSSRR